MEMRISALTSVFFGLLVTAALASGALTLWHSTQSRVWDQRIELAQASYAEHLLLQSNIYQLFKQHGDALLMGSRDGDATEAALRSGIATNLAEIRRIIGHEIDLVGESEIEELELLSRIEAKVQSLTRTLDNLGDIASASDQAPPRERLIETLMERSTTNWRCSSPSRWTESAPKWTKPWPKPKRFAAPSGPAFS